MSIVPLLLLCSLVLAAGSLVLFVWSCKQGDCHEADRLCLLPLEDDIPVALPELPTPVIPETSPIEGPRHA